ncbi:hypothetical protein IH992_06990 [Candidatus Poribacteria bacterium]|nr:hypothetical protein [Candidatus Poribacteria bacterium]
MKMTFHKIMRLALCLIICFTANVCMGAAWKSEKIGAGTKGSVKFEKDANQMNGEAITVTAITGDIWNAADTAMYVYKEISGDMEISARVTEHKPANPGWGKAGLMIRQSIDADSANAFLNLTETNGLKLIHRDIQGGPTGPGEGGADYDLPIYFRLTRKGDTITAFTSKDGKSWTEAGGGLGPSADIAMKGKVVASFALSSNDGAEAEVVFDMVDGTGDFALPVDPLDKLATTWAGIKTKY